MGLGRFSEHTNPGFFLDDASTSSVFAGGHGRTVQSAFLETPGVQVISCQATGAAVRFRGGVARVHCPAYCQREPSALALGSGLHPLSASVCASAVGDRVLPPEGGDLLLTKVAGVPSYSGRDGGAVISLPVTGEQGEAFHAYALDSIDMPATLPVQKALKCQDTFAGLKMPHVGSSVVVRCPGRCRGTGRLVGSGIYAAESSVCRAAEHAGVISAAGGRAVVTRRHGQDQYFGSSARSDQSVDGPSSQASYTVARPTAEYLARLQQPGQGKLLSAFL